MATEITLTKTSGGMLAPADPQAVEYIAKLKIGGIVRATMVKPRNPRFHRKFMALLNVAFDAWEPTAKEYKGEPVQKNFDQFRRDVVILSGYYETSYKITGEVRLTAKSISFASMDDAEFEQLYSAAINCILARILTRYSREDLDLVVERILAFD